MGVTEDSGTFVTGGQGNDGDRSGCDRGTGTVSQYCDTVPVPLSHLSHCYPRPGIKKTAPRSISETRSRRSVLFDAVLPQLGISGVTLLGDQGSLDQQGPSLVTVGVFDHLGR